MWDSNPRFLLQGLRALSECLNHSANLALLYITFAFSVTMLCLRVGFEPETRLSAVNLASLLSDKTGAARSGYDGRRSKVPTSS